MDKGMNMCNKCKILFLAIYTNAYDCGFWSPEEEYSY